jgi:rhamnogalacturonan endolyase
MVVHRGLRALLVASATAISMGTAGAGQPALAAGFGFTSGGGAFTVDTGAGLTFRIDQANGDLTSLRFNGVELQSQARRSHVESGLGSGATVTASQTGSVIVITESTNTWYGHGTLVQYLVAKSGVNDIFMATFVDGAGAGELRWYQSLNRGVLTNAFTPSDTRGGTVIESQDIFLAGGQTRSKYYSNRQAMNLGIRGVTGSGAGVYMDYGNRESSAGGPFFRDIEQQGTDNNDLYNYLWSAHNQTESQRLGVLYGPYALMVTNGPAPSPPDLSFIDSLGLRGSVPASARGAVTGTAAGVAAGMPALVGFANGQAQYWAVVRSDGQFTSPAMKPGTYTQTLFQNELAVATRTVSVTAGTTTAGQSITSGWATPPAIFRIGDWDGAPTSFENWSNLTSMHPSDARMRSWGPTTFTVGSSTVGDFPAYQWKAVNNPTTIRFSLASSQVGARTVRIGITAAFAGGRPQLAVNGRALPAPPASSQPSSRSLTIGTYRGNNVLYTFSIPAGVLVAGANTMTITVISGSGGTGFLSPGISYDAVELF